MDPILGPMAEQFPITTISPTVLELEDGWERALLKVLAGRSLQSMLSVVQQLASQSLHQSLWVQEEDMEGDGEEDTVVVMEAVEEATISQPTELVGEFVHTERCLVL